MVGLAYYSTQHTDCFRSGHAAVYCAFTNAILMFGGWPRSEELEEVAAAEANGCPLYSLSVEKLQAALAAPPRALEHHPADEARVSNVAGPASHVIQWEKITAGVMPRSRHGHHLVCAGHETFLFGGSYWAHGDSMAMQDMVYCHLEKRWYQVEPLCPPRFCAAVALAPGLARPAASCVVEQDPQSVLYVFGGLDVTRTPTNTLFRVWLPSRTFEEVHTVGKIPMPQFKSALVADSICEVLPVDRRSGTVVSGRLFHADGFLPDTSRVKRLHWLDLATGIWREVCHAPDLVRSQVLHVDYRSASLSPDASSIPVRRLRGFTLFGGMPSQKGKRFRCSTVVTFDADQGMWERAKAAKAPVAGLTAHAAVPTSFCAPGNVRIVAVSVGGNVDGGAGSATDSEGPSENSLGVQTNVLHLFCEASTTLKEIVTKRIHAMRIPCHVNVSTVRDDLLDELF